MNFGALSRGFSTCCLRFKNRVATIPAKLASGWLARLYREGVEPSGSLQKVSDHISRPPFLDLSWRKGSFILNLPHSSGRDVRFMARPPPRSVRAAFPHTACMGLSLSRVHHAIFVARCYSILLFDPRGEHSSIPTAHCRRRRAQWRSRTALLQRRRRLVLDGREHGGRLPVIGWSAAR